MHWRPRPTFAGTNAMKTTEHSWPPSHCALAAGFFRDLSTSAAHPFSRVTESSSLTCSNGKSPDSPHYLPDTDRISSDIVRIISPENPGVTRVISETSDFFYRHRPPHKNSFTHDVPGDRPCGQTPILTYMGPLHRMNQTRIIFMPKTVKTRRPLLFSRC